MNTEERLVSLISQLSKFGRATIAGGPAHPTSPNSSVLPLLNELLLRVPFVRQDAGYIRFLEFYWKASFRDLSTNTVVNLYPCLEIESDSSDSQLLDPEQEYPFATCTRYYRQPEGAGPPRIVMNMFFLAIGQLEPLDIRYVYAVPNTAPSKAITVYHGFLDWLEATVRTRGLLVEKRP